MKLEEKLWIENKIQNRKEIINEEKNSKVWVILIFNSTFVCFCYTFSEKKRQRNAEGIIILGCFVYVTTNCRQSLLRFSFTIFLFFLCFKRVTKVDIDIL